MATERSHRRHTPTSGPVALFVDWDNFAIGLLQEMPERPPDLGPILRWARRAGTLIVCRAYGEWRDATERLAIYNAGVDAVYAPVLPLGGSLAARSGAGGAKSLADTAMAVDVAEFLTLVPSVQTLILATSDKDLIPVIRFAQKRGVYSGVVGSDRTAGALRELADDFVSYRQLLEDEAPQPVAVSRPVTVPPLRIARPLRRYSDSSAEAQAPIIRDTRPAASPPTFARREPIISATVAPEPPAEQLDPDSDSARRRRRGGRRRRGAETLALGDVTSPPEELLAPDGLENASRPLADSEQIPPSVANTRPLIVPPMIAPRAPRPPAERFASQLNQAPRPLSGPIATRPEPAPAPIFEMEEADAPAPAMVSAPPDPSSTSANTTDEMSPPDPTVATPLAGDSLTEGAPIVRPRVQLPGERLRRLVSRADPTAMAATPDVTPVAVSADLVAPEPTPDAFTAEAPQPDEVPNEPVSLAHDLLGQAPPANEAREFAPLADADPGTEPHSQDEAPTVPPGDEETAEDAPSRARRRRGSRQSRSASDGGTVDTPKVIIDGPIASPNDPDAAGAPDTGTDEPVRGRRRGGRSRVTA